MAQQDFLLSGTEHEQQRAEFVCGAASVNMILSYWDKQQPQEDIWAAIQQNTGSLPRPVNAEQMEGWFPNQHCDSCAAGGYNCWFTTPEAMATTLNGIAPIRFTPEYHQGPDDACRSLAENLSGSNPLPGAFTKSANLHWSVAVGYQLNGPSTGYPWNGNQLTALYIRDPNTLDPGNDIIHLLTTDGLQRPVDGLLMAVVCGPLARQYPIVVKSKETPWWWVLATSWVPRLHKKWPGKRWIPRQRTPPPPPQPPPSQPPPG